jgi:signal transduction histidine kinase/CheY-like chemotaxis protein
MPGKSTHILLVEDNPGDARLVREMLAETGGGSFAVDWVTSLSEALEHLGRGGIDLVLLDLGLPDSRGLETFLRAHAQASHLPFLVLTGYADETFGSTAVSQGAQDYLPKGEVTGSLLHRAIRYAIERKRSGEELVKKTHDLGERVKELYCLYNVANLLAQPNISLDEIIQGVLELIPPGWHYPDNTCARITFMGHTLRTANFRETPWRLASDILVNGDNFGCVEVFCLESKPTLDEGPFLHEERSLLDSIAKALGGTIERKRSDEKVAEEHQKLFSLLDGLPALVYLKAPDYVIRFANRVFRDTFGPWEGKRCYEVVFGRQAPCQDCPSFTVLKTNAPHQWEWTVPHGARTYQVHNYPFADTDGSPLVLTLGIDITERKRTEKTLRESEKKLRLLADQLLTAQEDERQRISGELHDELGHALLTLKLDLRSIEKQLLPEQQALAGEVESMLGYIDEVIKNVRRLYLGLSPGDLEDLGLTAALKSLIDEFSQHNQGMTWSIDLDDIDGLFPLAFQTNIYRIFQEILTNIGKHAAPTHVSIVIRKTHNKVLFEVDDNGRGFNYDNIVDGSYNQGMGLIVMEERVRIMGGSFNVSSQEKQGTKITFTIQIS